jgi:hypothetical protein
VRQAAFLLLFLGMSLAFATSVPAERAAPAPCKLAGIHYVGLTAQKQKVCMTLSATGKTLKEYSFGGRFKCTDGTRDVGDTHITPGSTSVAVGGTYIVSAGAGETPSKITDVARNGTFDGSIGLRATGANGYEIDSTFTGRITGRTVTGVLRQRIKFGDPASPDLVCDSGRARWSARRAAR